MPRRIEKASEGGKRLRCGETAAFGPMFSLVPRREPEVMSNLISRGTEIGANKEGNYPAVICSMVPY